MLVPVLVSPPEPPAVLAPPLDEHAAPTALPAIAMATVTKR